MRLYDGVSFRGKHVNNVGSGIFGLLTEHIVNSRQGKCDVYWGCHACNESTAHQHDTHMCQCGCTPHGSSVLWGTGLTETEILDTAGRQIALSINEQRLSWSDDFDKDGNYKPDRKRRSKPHTTSRLKVTH